jgi:hypothetical protein
MQIYEIFRIEKLKIVLKFYTENSRIACSDIPRSCIKSGCLCIPDTGS